MKAFVLATVLVVMFDCAFDHGAGVRATWTLVERLVDGTERDVGGSVFRR